ncbi:hypothetical protein C8J57DRAFT_210306 [Mycena rebaudengoi]|nr:hypothetical protein C8J57DRAFT_210306 [Mycena rebaudengoi]
MILDEKVLSPLSSYTKASATSAWRTFSALPPHLLLQIVYATFSDAYDVEEQRKTLYWLSTGLRLVNRPFYSTSMNVLRSIFLPAYNSLIRPPYTSDPFPHTARASSSSPLASVQRETATLDLFIAVTVRENVWADDSDLHLSRGESITDLFALMQPRSRLEDLVLPRPLHPCAPRRRQLFCAPRRPTRTSSPKAARARASTSSSSFWRKKPKAEPPTPPPSMKVTISPLPFSVLSISFSAQRVGLVLTTPGTAGANRSRRTGSKRTVVEVTRTRDEALESAAWRLVWALRDWLVDGA